MNKEGEKNNLLKHFVVIGAGTVLNMLIGLLTTPIITRLVSPDDYGQLSLFNTYSNIAMMVLCLGLDQALVRFFYDRDDMSYKKALIKFCVGVPLAAALAISVLFITIINIFNIKLEFDNKVFLLLALNVIASIILRISLLVLRVSYASKKYSLCQVIQRVTYAILAIILVKTIDGNYFWLLCISVLLSNVLALLFAIFSKKEYWSFSSSCNLNNRKEIVKYGIPLIFAMGLTELFQALDKISLDMYRTFSEVGIYASAMSLVNIFAVIQTAFNALWGPLQVEHYVKHPDDPKFIQKGNEIITIVMFFLGTNLILCRDLFALLLGSEYREASGIIPFLIFHPIMYTISETSQCGIGISKKSYYSVVVAGVACGVNFLGNMILVPILGCVGAALSTGVSYIVFWLARTIISNRFYYIDYHIFKFAILTIMVFFYAASATFEAELYIQIILYFLCMASLCIMYKRGIIEGISLLMKQIKHRKSSEET